MVNPLKNAKLESFVQYSAYERGHSAGQDEVDGIVAALRDGLRDVDDYILELERLTGKVDTTLDS